MTFYLRKEIATHRMAIVQRLRRVRSEERVLDCFCANVYFYLFQVIVHLVHCEKKKKTHKYYIVPF